MKSTVTSWLGVVVAILLLLSTFPVVEASSTDGTIDPNTVGNQYAWSNNAGWINFKVANPGDGPEIHITSAGITGYAWNENLGWINMDPTGSGVVVDDDGNLSGSAWGENTGYIDFSGVFIDADGFFGGTATGTIIGTVNFDCATCVVETDFRPVNAQNGGNGRRRHLLVASDDTDIDGDGIENVFDPDIDGDGIANVFDDDADGDGITNELDDDDDGDSILDADDTSPIGTGVLSDIDGDGVENAFDPDVDGDGILNVFDLDIDGDGIGNDLDDDDDGDFFSDTDDDTPHGPGVFGDVDGDGVPDESDDDVDGDGILNMVDPDFNGNGVPDNQESVVGQQNSGGLHGSGFGLATDTSQCEPGEIVQDVKKIRIYVNALQGLTSWISPEDYELRYSWKNLRDDYQMFFLQKRLVQILGEQACSYVPFSYIHPEEKILVNLQEVTKAMVLSFSFCFDADAVNAAHYRDYEVGGDHWWDGYSALLDPFWHYYFQNVYSLKDALEGTAVSELMLSFLNDYCVPQFE